MCTRVSCSHCGKPSYVGCGRHIEQVLANVPEKERCHCRDERTDGARTERSLFERIFGKV
jgi:hypothetical protein